MNAPGRRSAMNITKVDILSAVIILIRLLSLIFGLPKYLLPGAFAADLLPGAFAEPFSRHFDAGYYRELNFRMQPI